MPSRCGGSLRGKPTRAYVAERRRLRETSAARERELRRELGELQREQDRIVSTIGRVPEAAVDALAARLGLVAERIAELKAEIAPAEASVVDLNRFSATAFRLST